MKIFKPVNLFAVFFVLISAGCGAQAVSQPAETSQAGGSASETATVVTVDMTPAAAETAGAWKIVHQFDDVEQEVSVAGFLNETFGITVGLFGEVRYTIDSGKTWVRAKNVSADLYGLDIVDENLAWAAGSAGNVRVSEDGGRVWRAVADAGIGVIKFVSFLDEKTGWVASNSKVAATGDGGQTWTDVALPTQALDLAAVSLRTASEGYIVDPNGSLFETRDGGGSWTAKSLHVDQKLIVVEKMPFAAVRFTDSDHGIIIACLENGGGALLALKTEDGGESWTRELLPVKSGMLFLTRDAGYLTVYGTSLILLEDQTLMGR